MRKVVGLTAGGQLRAWRMAIPTGLLGAQRTAVSVHEQLIPIRSQFVHVFVTPDLSHSM